MIHSSLSINLFIVTLLHIAMAFICFMMYAYVQMQSGKVVHEKDLLPLIPYIPKLVMQISGSWRPRMLQVLLFPVYIQLLMHVIFFISSALLPLTFSFTSLLYSFSLGFIPSSIFAGFH